MLSTLYRKAQAYEAGETIEFGGKKYPPLYTPRNSTLLALFNVQETEIPHLKTIIPKATAAERDRQRHRKQGDRAVYLETIKENTEQRRMQAQLLMAKELAIRDIALEMKVSKSQVYRYLQ